MAINAYDNCPCGSGKKFKWCCAAFFDKIELAIEQQQQGQHDAALRTMDELTKAHPQHPQVWCYFANILAAEGKTDQAEEALQKALSLQPDFAMALMLRGYFRLNEGEVIGALLLFRKAAEAYSPEATTQLANIHEMIARQETLLNRPVAARAALERAAKFNPADAELRQQLEIVFGENSRLPNAARTKYTFRPTAKLLPPGVESGKLSDAKKAVEAIAKQFPTDPAALFNLGLVHAWLGENGPALQNLNQSLEHEVDDFRAEETGALIEVLKCAEGADADTDFVEHRIILPIRDGEPVFRLLQQLESEQRLLGAQIDNENGVFTALIVEELPSLLETGTTMGKVVSNLLVGGGVVRLWFPIEENVKKIAGEIRDRVSLAVGEPIASTGPVNFAEIGIEAVAYPLRSSNPEEAEKKMREHAERYLLDVLPMRPFKALSGTTPMDAVGSKLLRKKLIGLLRFLEDCFMAALPKRRGAAGSVEPMQLYDFTRLRHKLGLELSAADAPQLATTSVDEKRDFSAMSPADLGQLPIADLSTAELEEAMRAAIRLQAHELAVAFAKAGAARPIDAEKPDRYPFFACMMTGSVALGQLPEAMAALREGAAWDVAHNGSRRANEYGLRIAALYAKMGDADKSVDAFDAVIERHPNEGNLYVKAAETMLSIKNGAKARYFAEKGIAKAKSLSNRDLQGACEELLAAAKKLM